VEARGFAPPPRGGFAFTKAAALYLEIRYF